MQEQETHSQFAAVQHGQWWRSLGLGCAFLAVFALASHRAIGMTTLEFGLFVLLLSIPAMAALWHQSTVKHLVHMHQFASGSGLRWLASRRLFSVLLHAVFALLLTEAVLVQSVLFGRTEWVLVAIAPMLYLGIRNLISHRVERQFTGPAYAFRWVFRATQLLLTVSLVLFWLGAHIAMAEPSIGTVTDAVFDLQQRWANSPSGLVKWSLDASAWVQATINALDWTPGKSFWWLVASLFFTPVLAFGYVSLSLYGSSLPVSEMRRIVGEPLTDADTPPPVGPVRAAIWAAVATVGVVIFFQAMGVAEGLLSSKENPFALQRLPECERIGGAVYKVNTIKTLEAFMAGMGRQMAGQETVACTSLDGIEAAADKGIDRYLDWYFSLGAEWARTLSLLTGSADELLNSKLQELVFSDPSIATPLEGIKDHFERLSVFGTVGKEKAEELLAEQRLVLTDQQCKVVKELAVNPWTPKFEAFSARLATGSAAGLLGGGIAATIASKAMAKAGMKSAAKVLAKAAAKKAAAKVASGAAGATIGTAVFPGVGTLVGGAIGVIAGIAVGAGVDMAMLAAEENLTRADIKAELLSAFTETLQPYRDAFACGK